MSAKMRSAPVYFTIAQVRFSPILTLDTYAPQIEERLRRERSHSELIFHKTKRQRSDRRLSA
jgi:hypothetical protein